MGGASEKDSLGERDAVGNPLNESTGDLQAQGRIGATQHDDGDLNHTVQIPGQAEQQQQREDKESITKEALAAVVSDEGGAATPEKELGLAEQDQAVPSHDPATTQLANGESSLEPTNEYSKTNSIYYWISDVNTKEVNQEPGSYAKPLSHQEASSSIAKLSDLQTPGRAGSRVDDHDGKLAQPLSIPEHTPDRVDFDKHEPKPEEHRKVYLANETQSPDAIGAAMHQKDDVMHVPDINEAFDKSLDTAGYKLSEGHHEEQALPNEEPEKHGGDLEIHENETTTHKQQGNNLQLPTTDETLPEQLEDVAQSEGAQEASPDSQCTEEELSKTQDIPGESDNNESENEEDVDEDQDEEEQETDNSNSKSALNVQDLWGQRHQLFAEDRHFIKPAPTLPHPGPRASSQFMSNTNYEQYETPRHTSQNLAALEDPHNFDLRVDYQRQQQVQIERQRRQMAQDLYGGQQPGLRMPVGFDQSRPNMAPAPMMSVDYRNVPQAGYQYAGFTQYPMGLQNPGHPASGYGPIPPHSVRRPFPPHGYSMASRPSIPLASDDRQFGPHSGSFRPTIERPLAYSQNRDEGDGVSDDDEPLKTRVKRHPSVTSQDSIISDSSLVREAKQMRQGSGQYHDSDPKLSTTQNPVRMHRSLPQPMQTSPDIPSSPSSGNEIGSWKLPQFEVQRQPVDKKEDLPSVKVSLPNMVREELLLSADHSEQEVHLLLNLFLPGQQALENPDPAPATALLNFHTIALMVVEAFVQYEIGDEFGMGRGHFHQNHDQNDEEYERMRDAKDANIDEIFFAVIDRWRAGLESRKQPVLLIRGAQEFCDVALDVIYYIKEHGLFKPEPVARRGRADKGAKGGARKGKEEHTADASKGKGKGKVDVDEESQATRGVKRAVAPKVNTLQPRKKVKTEKPTKKKTKSKGPEITVIRRK